MVKDQGIKSVGKTHFIVAMMIFSLMSATVFVPKANAQAPSNPLVQNALFNATINGVTTQVQGVLEITGFKATKDGVLQAIGKVSIPSLNVKNAKFTAPVNSINETDTSSLQALAETCNILTLNLGPIHLDLLGLVIDLDQVNLVIDAVADSGNLLGNLLCAVAGLLDGGFSLNIVADLLNAIVAVINSLGL